MLERLLDLITRLKTIFLKMETTQVDYSATVNEIVILKSKIDDLEKDQNDAMKALDDLEEVIKKWES